MHEESVTFSLLQVNMGHSTTVQSLYYRLAIFNKTKRWLFYLYDIIAAVQLKNNWSKQQKKAKRYEVIFHLD